MKKVSLILVTLGIFFAMGNYVLKFTNANDISPSWIKFDKKNVVNQKNSNTITKYKIAKNTENKETVKYNTVPKVSDSEYTFPKFYRGIYLTNPTATNFKKLSKFVKLSKKSHINAFVMDVQGSRLRKNIVSAKNIKYLIDNGIHPIARVVVFPNGLRRYPVPKAVLDGKLKIAEDACINGFKEIQFDYIRFNDSARNRHVSLKERYKFIEGFLLRAKKHLAKYKIKIAADVFGRIPLNRRDVIGQRMEGLDEVVDIICPMAYPSHYTWTRKYYADPYYTVFKTSSSAKKRTKKAEIVSYIQAFRMKLSGIPYEKYIYQQIKAVHDSKIRGFLFWNARQKYTIPFKATRSYYLNNSGLIKESS